MYFTKVSEPKSGEFQVVVKVKATALNRADILQRKGTTLRNRDLTYKSRLIEDLVHNTWNDFGEGHLFPVVGEIFPWEEVIAAHSLMESNTSHGKIVLTL